MVLAIRYASTATKAVTRAAVLPSLESISAAQLAQQPQPKSYFIQRTTQGNLPIYKTVRSQKEWTDVKRIQGDVVSFRNDVQEAFIANKIAFDEPDFVCMIQSSTLRIQGDYVKVLHKVLGKVF